MTTIFCYEHFSNPVTNFYSAKNKFSWKSVYAETNVDTNPIDPEQFPTYDAERNLLRYWQPTWDSSFTSLRLPETLTLEDSSSADGLDKTRKFLADLQSSDWFQASMIHPSTKKGFIVRNFDPYKEPLFRSRKSSAAFATLILSRDGIEAQKVPLIGLNTTFPTAKNKIIVAHEAAHIPQLAHKEEARIPNQEAHRFGLSAHGPSFRAHFLHIIHRTQGADTFGVLLDHYGRQGLSASFHPNTVNFDAVHPDVLSAISQKR